MEPEGSLPYSQEPVTSVCPQPDESSPTVLPLYCLARFKEFVQFRGPV
jgi:hypothetical protein